jgi:hypothetical protein
MYVDPIVYILISESIHSLPEQFTQTIVSVFRIVRLFLDLFLYFSTISIVEGI